MTTAEQIKIYCTNWCPSCRRVKSFFDTNEISYQWIDIDKEMDGKTFVEKTNNGNRSVPTILFSDGSILVEPSEKELRSKLGI